MTATRTEDRRVRTPAGRGRAVASATWQAKHARHLVITDTLSVVWAVAGAHVLRFGWSDVPITGDQWRAGYAAFSIILVVAWLVALTIHGSRDRRTVGMGAEEYKAILSASYRLFGAVAICAFVFGLSLARSYVAVVFPIGTLALLASRWLWRQWLQLQRMQGRCQSRMLVIGHPAHAADLVRALRRDVHCTYEVVAACVPGGRTDEGLAALGVAVVGDMTAAIAGADLCGADVIAVASAEDLRGQSLKRLAWSLEGSGIELVVAPSLVDIAGPRVHVRPVAGLPLLYLEEPRLEGASRVTKRVFDVVMSAVGLLILSPVLVVCAALIKLTSAGPVFFRQERVGVNGETFRIFKLRTMHADAERRLAEVMGDSGGIRPLYKLKDDPRITPLGKTLRKYSLDELPQLLNVVAGSMSVVGPRPQIQAEVEQYEADHRRRLLVRPGITGLWQVSGRSELSWDDSVRLDLYYVENWSLATDLVIVLKTMRTVVEGAGAY